MYRRCPTLSIVCSRVLPFWTVRRWLERYLMCTLNLISYQAVHNATVTASPDTTGSPLTIASSRSATICTLSVALALILLWYVLPMHRRHAMEQKSSLFQTEDAILIYVLGWIKWFLGNRGVSACTSYIDWSDDPSQTFRVMTVQLESRDTRCTVFFSTDHFPNSRALLI